MIYSAIDLSNEQWHCYVRPKGADGTTEYECTLSKPREERPPVDKQTSVPPSFDHVIPVELSVFDQYAAIWFVVAVAIIVAGIATHRKTKLNHWFLLANSVWLLAGLFGLLSMVLFRAQL